VPHTGSETWTSSLGFSVKTSWQPWYIEDEGYKQVGGYSVEYEEGLTYATVKGAGHMVPQMRPEEALKLFTRFVHGKDLDS
jgi:serine carboxypeptidase-like clade 1